MKIIEKFLDELKKYYDFEIGYNDSRLLVENLNKKNEQYFYMKKNIEEISFDNLIEEYSCKLFKKGSHHLFNCYLIFKKGLIDDTLFNEKTNDIDKFTNPIVLLGYNSITCKLSLLYLSGKEKLNIDIIKKINIKILHELSVDGEKIYKNKTQKFIDELKKYYEFDISNDKKIFIDNIRDDYKYRDSLIADITSTPIEQLIIDLTEGNEFKCFNEKYVCYIVIRKGLVDNAYIHKQEKNENNINVIYWYDTFYNPVVFIGFDTLKKDFILYFYTGIGSLNWEIFKQISDELIQI